MSFFQSFSHKLPDNDILNSLLKKVITVLASEEEGYRPKTEDGNLGGFLSFEDDLPTILVPDLHARVKFLEKIFNCKKIPNQKHSVYELMKKNKLRVICLGDGLHSEKRGKERWLNAYNEYLNGNILNKYIRKEMSEGLSLMSLVMQTKCEMPKNFHFLKGNHENILNETSDGNFSFFKFASEGEMCFDFMVNFYGVETTELYADFESLLPLFVKGKNFLASHAEPAFYMNKKQLINSMSNGEIIKALTWTRNGDVEDFPAVQMLDEFLQDYPESLYFAGHRPVSGNFELRENNRFVQIHNPDKMNVVYIDSNRSFNFETDFISLD